jgi:hypothetical protein
MEKKDIPVVHQLLTRYLKQFHLTPIMSQEEVEHWFYPQENIIDTFVVEVSLRTVPREAAPKAVRLLRTRYWHSILPRPSMFSPVKDKAS